MNSIFCNWPWLRPSSLHLVKEMHPPPPAVLPPAHNPLCCAIADLMANCSGYFLLFCLGHCTSIAPPALSRALISIISLSDEHTSWSRSCSHCCLSATHHSVRPCLNEQHEKGESHICRNTPVRVIIQGGVHSCSSTALTHTIKMGTATPVRVRRVLNITGALLSHSCLCWLVS